MGWVGGPEDTAAAATVTVPMTVMVRQRQIVFFSASLSSVYDEEGEQADYYAEDQVEGK